VKRHPLPALLALPALLVMLPTLASCVPYAYSDYYRLDAQYLARRQQETRRFETEDEDAMLVASAQVLQDLGFTLEESETKLGLITASKARSAMSAGGVAGAILLAALFKTDPIYDVDQKIYTTLVSTKSRDAGGFNVRVEFARVIRNNRNHTRVEVVREPEIYRDFFDKLAQSLFLVANDI
jgi:hypothetical protein